MTTLALALLLLTILKFTAALSPEKRIIGGTHVTYDELTTRYPYIASLQWGNHRCGGTLVAMDMVITAAHCVYMSLEQENEIRIDPTWFTSSQIIHDSYVPAIHTVQLGKLDLHNTTTSNNGEDETLIVEKIIKHPYFNIKTSGDKPPYPDIALLKLYGSSTVNQYARLDNPHVASDWTKQESQTEQTQYQFTTMGYGLDESQQISNVLKQTTLNYVPNDVCKAQGLWDLINKDMICAFGEGKRDSCNGDSGGPLFWENENGIDVQVGIVSWGIGCADEWYPGVYTKISSHYGWIRTQICQQSRSPPSNYNCPRRYPLSNSLPQSYYDLVILFQYPPSNLGDYGLLVESLDDLDAEPLLYIPPGSFPVGVPYQQYALQVQLGHRYRVVLLNTSGRAYSRGKIFVKWGEEVLVDEYTQQQDNNLLVYAIERSFRIADVEGGVPTVDLVQTTSPTSRPPTSKPTHNLFSPSTNEALPDADNLFKADPVFISFGAGFHTIDTAYVSNLGYTNSLIPAAVNVTSQSFTMITHGVTIAPMKGNAISLNGSAYVLANGGIFIGSSLGNVLDPGYGMYVQGNGKLDVMQGSVVKGGNAVGQGQSAGAALYASGKAMVTIRGGEFYGGTNSSSEVVGHSLEVMENASIIIYGGSFFGNWNVRGGGSILIHACSFTITSGSVVAKLLDSTFLNVSFMSDNLGQISAKFHTQQECVGDAATGHPTRLSTVSPTTSPTPLSPSSGPSQQPSMTPSISSTAPSQIPSVSPTYTDMPSSRPTSRNVGHGETSSISTESLFESSLPPASVSMVDSSLPPALSPTPTTKRVWTTADFAPPDEFSVSYSRPMPLMEHVPKECLEENTESVCFNSELVLLDTAYLSSNFGDGILRTQVQIYNRSEVALHAAVAPLDSMDAVRVLGRSNVKAGFGADLIGGVNSSGLVFTTESSGKLMDGARVTGGRNSAALSVQSGSDVTITGGSYYGGPNDQGIGSSISVEGIGSGVSVLGGSFLGSWFVGFGSHLTLYGCDFTINGDTVQGYLADGTTLNVAVKVLGVLYFEDNCPDVIGGLEEDGMAWTSSATNSSSLLPQNTFVTNRTDNEVNEYSYVIGPVTTTSQIVFALSDEDDHPNFYVDKMFFAATTSYFIDQFYSATGKEAYDVQTDIEVLEVKQVGATLNVEITYEQTSMYRSRFRTGGLVSDTGIEDIIRGPFLNKQDRIDYIMLMNRNENGLLVSSITIPELISESKTTLPNMEENKPSTSKLLWSLAGVFIVVIICCCGFTIVGLKQLADVRTQREAFRDEEARQVEVRRPERSSTAYSKGEFGVDNGPLAETGIPLIATYKSFNRENSHGTLHRDECQCTITSRLTFVSAGSSLSVGSEAIDIEVPPGKLALILAFSETGYPVIQAIRGPSVVNGYVQVGDRLAFIDRKDVRTIDPNVMAQIMDLPCNNCRKITVFRCGDSDGSEVNSLT